MKLSASSQRFLFPLVFSSIFISKSLAQTTEIDILFQQKIPMRDGVNLSANIYIPAQMNSPLPVILMITPYGMTEYNLRFDCPQASRRYSADNIRLCQNDSSPFLFNFQYGNLFDCSSRAYSIRLPPFQCSNANIRLGYFFSTTKFQFSVMSIKYCRLRHSPELCAGFRNLKHKHKMLKQVQHDILTLQR